MKKLLFILLLVVHFSVYSHLGAAERNIFEATVNKPITEVYPNMIESIE
jgi:hypothetical protein